MRTMRSLLVLGLALGLGAGAGAQAGKAPTDEIQAAGSADGATPTFSPPVRLPAGTKLLGENRLFPSPVFHDVNGDGRLDIVVGDLIGKLTVALREPGDAVAFGAETKLMDVDGKEIDFHNW